MKLGLLGGFRVLITPIITVFICPPSPLSRLEGCPAASFRSIGPGRRPGDFLAGAMQFKFLGFRCLGFRGLGFRV